METFGDKKRAKTSKNEHYCEYCDYTCSKKYNWERHILTAKHRKVTVGDEKRAKTSKNEQLFLSPDNQTRYFCEYCNNSFISRNGIWKHKQKCKRDVTTDKEILLSLIKENSDLKNMMMKVIENGTHNTTNTNSHNKAFNLNFFLNETCKDAMNITDFINSIKLNLEDLENTGKRGYIEGISSIIVKNLNNLEQHMRPLHCSNLKHEVLYIKENDKWEKEMEKKPILTKAIKFVANENIKQIQNWMAKNPKCTNSESKYNDMFLRIVGNSMIGCNEEESQKNINKIISNIAKGTLIQKN
jgi:hypothetical protein